MFNQMFNGMFGKIKDGLCRLSMNGGIAISTSSGYKTYNVKKRKLTNCSNFVFDMGSSDFFFVIPTNKVQEGDIILVNGKPRCVVSIDNKAGTISVINYEDSTLETILPERHVFMGNTYFYGKIVSLFGSNFGKGTGNQIMKYMMLSQMFGGSGVGSTSNNMLPMMMLMNGNSFDTLFDGMFDGADNAVGNTLTDMFTDTNEDDEDSEEEGDN